MFSSEFMAWLEQVQLPPYELEVRDGADLPADLHLETRPVRIRVLRGAQPWAGARLTIALQSGDVLECAATDDYGVTERDVPFGGHVCVRHDSGRAVTLGPLAVVRGEGPQLVQFALAAGDETMSAGDDSGPRLRIVPDLGSARTTAAGASGSRTSTPDSRTAVRRSPVSWARRSSRTMRLMPSRSFFEQWRQTRSTSQGSISRATRTANCACGGMVDGSAKPNTPSRANTYPARASLKI